MTFNDCDDAASELRKASLTIHLLIRSYHTTMALNHGVSFMTAGKIIEVHAILCI